MAIIKFTSTKLKEKNKKGILKKDEDGYYEICVGGLNTYNSVGEFYTATNDVVKIFTEGSSFMRRLRNGALYSELGHPQRQPGMSIDDYYRRVINIDQNNVSGHFKDIWLDTDYGKNNPEFGSPTMIGIMGLVKPSGMKAQALESIIENPNCNVAFSVRGITENKLVNGRTERDLTEVITFDQVPEPGIAAACRFNTPSLEELADITIDKSLLVKVAEECLSDNFAKESDRIFAKEIIQMFRVKPSSNKIYNW